MQNSQPQPPKILQATRTLPDAYEKIGTLDLSKNKRLAVLLNVGAVLLVFVTGWLFLRAAAWLRPPGSFNSDLSISIDSAAGWLRLSATIIGLCIIYIPLHEAVHGLCFWIYTRSRPHFAIRLSYAYAAAPDWYIPRNSYLVTALAPLVGITLVGLALIALAPAQWVLPVWFVITMNASGSIGDLLAAAWLLRNPPTCLAQDRGDVITLFVPRSAASSETF